MPRFEKMQPAIPGETRLGWIGTGVMGASMCKHLMAAGFPMGIFNRTKSKAQPLIDLGAEWYDSPREVAAASDIVFSIVGFPSDVREVILDRDVGVLSGLKTNGCIVDMTTSEPSLAQEISEGALAQDCWALDAPVSGGDIGARNATLSIMIGGEKTAFDALQPCWEKLGTTIVHQGPSGAGQHTKMVNQTLIATMMVGVCEALLYGYRAGLDLETVLKSVSSGAAGSWSLTNLAPRIIQQDFGPGFFVEHFLKDLTIAISEADRMQLELPGLQLARDLYEALAAQGHARSGTQALIIALAKISKQPWPPAAS